MELESINILFRELNKIPVLSLEEERQLFKAYQGAQGQEKEGIRKQLIESNLRLVRYVACKYIGYDMPLVDIFQNGCIGLMKAIEKFDVSLGYKFSTYAVNWIRQSILIGISEQAYSFKMPYHAFADLQAYRSAESQLTVQLGRYPTDEEIQEQLGVSLEKVKYFKNFSEETVSLALELDEEQFLLEDILFDEDYYNPERETLIEENKDFVHQKFLRKLTTVEQYVLLLKYGIYDGEEYSLDEIAVKLKELGVRDKVVTRQRINQIEMRALKKCKRKVGKWS